MPLPIGIARRRFGPGLGFAKQAQGQFPPTGAIRFGAGAGNDGLVSLQPVGFNAHTVWGWFRFRQSQLALLVQMCGASLESVAPDGTGPYQLLFETTFQTNTVELHDDVNGGFLFTPTMAPMEWWFIASTNNRYANPSAGQTTFYARKMGNSAAMTAITGNTHPAATKPTRFLVGTDDAGGQNEWWDGDIAGVGVASREYSLAEIDAQSRQLYPVSTLGLHAFYPLSDTASMLLDASGKQRHLAPIVSGGSWSRIDGPQIPTGFDAFTALAADQGPTPRARFAPYGSYGRRNFDGLEGSFRPFQQATDQLATPTVTGTIAVVEADDTLAAAGSTVTGTVMVTESGDTAAAAGSSTTGTAAVTEAGDVAASAGSTVTGTAALTEAADVAAASGSVVDFTGTVAVTEAGDTAAASGSSTTGSVAVTEANDTAAAAGSSVTGTIALTEAADVMASSGTDVDFIGTVTVTEAPDSAAGAGSSVTGALALTEAGNSCSAAGTFGATGVTGSIAVVEASDTIAATGAVIEIIAITGAVEGPTAVTGAADGALALAAAAEGPVSLHSYADGVLSLVGQVE